MISDIEFQLNIACQFEQYRVLKERTFNSSKNVRYLYATGELEGRQKRASSL